MRSPYCGSSLGSSTIRRAATTTPGGGGPFSLSGKSDVGIRIQKKHSTCMFPFSLPSRKWTPEWVPYSPKFLSTNDNNILWLRSNLVSGITSYIQGGSFVNTWICNWALTWCSFPPAFFAQVHHHDEQFRYPWHQIRVPFRLRLHIWNRHSASWLKVRKVSTPTGGDSSVVFMRWCLSITFSNFSLMGAGFVAVIAPAISYPIENACSFVFPGSELIIMLTTIQTT